MLINNWEATFLSVLFENTVTYTRCCPESECVWCMHVSVCVGMFVCVCVYACGRVCIFLLVCTYVYDVCVCMIVL